MVVGFSVNCCEHCGLGCRDACLHLFVHSRVLIRASLSCQRLEEDLASVVKGGEAIKENENRKPEQTMAGEQLPHSERQEKEER